VRSLARDIALRLGTVGYVKTLRRLSAAPFSEKDAILLDSILKVGHNTVLINYVLPLQDALADILALEVDNIEAVKFRHGQILPSPHKADEEVVLILSEGKPLALGKVKEGLLIPRRVFNI